MIASSILLVCEAPSPKESRPVLVALVKVQPSPRLLQRDTELEMSCFTIYVLGWYVYEFALDSPDQALVSVADPEAQKSLLT